MDITNGDCGCRLWQPVQADSQPKPSGLVFGRRPLGAVLHSSNEPGELSQWLCHDDSTINIVLDIIIIIICPLGGSVCFQTCIVNMVGLPLTWLTDRVLQCWFCHLTSKIVAKMSHDMTSGTLK